MPSLRGGPMANLHMTYFVYGKFAYDLFCVLLQNENGTSWDKSYYMLGLDRLT